MIRKRLFSAVARFDVSHPWIVIMAAAALSILSILYTKARLEFRTGQDDLISADSRDSRNYLRYTSEFPDLDGLIVVIPTEPSARRAEQFADTLSHKLNADPVNVKSVFYRIDPATMNGRALLYLHSGELAAMAHRIEQRMPLLRRYAADPSLANLFGIADAQINHATAALGKDGHDRAASDAKGGASIDPRFFAAMLNGMLADPAASAPSPWGDLIDAAGHDSERDSYVSSDNGKYLLMQVAPVQGVKDGADPVDVIQADVDAVRAQFPDVAAGMTGGPALANAERTTTQHDMALASIIAVVGLVLLLVIPFRGLIEPAFAIIALLTGVAWSFGFTTLAVGRLNLLSAVFTSVLAGIGINFPIHLMARYDEARRKGLAMPMALDLAVVNTGSGVFASACIMALAFLMPMFTDFKGIAELGEISAAGLFLCLISAMTVFPSLIALRDRSRPQRPAPKLSLAPPRSMLERMFARPGAVIATVAAGTVAAAFLMRGVRFDQNVLKLQAGGVEAVKFENLLLRDSGRSSWFAVALTTTRAEADREAAAFRKLPEVSDAQTISTYVPEHQAEKCAILAGLALDLAPISIHTEAIREGSPRLMRELGDLADKLETIRRADSSGVAGRIEALVRQAMAKLARDPNAFIPYEHRIAANLSAQLNTLKAQLSPGEITAANLPPVLRQRFIGATGKYLVQVYPKGDVWADKPLKNFVTALKTVDRDVTGPPVQTYTIATVMRIGYERAAALALIAVFVFVFADFRNLRDTLLATVPLAFGGAWLLEAMGALGWDFNLANLFAVPIIIGMGVDNGVNMLYRWREERDKSSLILTKAVGKSVTICSLTTIAAFAALIPATHRGISSLGWVLTLGVSFILLATLVVLPALFELFGSRIERGDAPMIAPRRVKSRSTSELPRRHATGR
jgi:hopanoid biosynthesis associated RND transporter like protein HpnN